MLKRAQRSAHGVSPGLIDCSEFDDNPAPASAGPRISSTRGTDTSIQDEQPVPMYMCGRKQRGSLRRRVRMQKATRLEIIAESEARYFFMSDLESAPDAIRTFLLCWSALVFPPPQAVCCVTALLLGVLFVVGIFDISVHVIGLRLIRFYPEEGSHGMRAFSAFSR